MCFSPNHLIIANLQARLSLVMEHLKAEGLGFFFVIYLMASAPLYQYTLDSSEEDMFSSDEGIICFSVVFCPLVPFKKNKKNDGIVIKYNTKKIMHFSNFCYRFSGCSTL